MEPSQAIPANKSRRLIKNCTDAYNCILNAFGKQSVGHIEQTDLQMAVICVNSSPFRSPWCLVHKPRSRRPK
eukprot:5487005-Amphidinium_carterae.1